MPSCGERSDRSRAPTLGAGASHGARLVNLLLLVGGTSGTYCRCCALPESSIQIYSGSSAETLRIDQVHRVLNEAKVLVMAAVWKMSTVLYTVAEEAFPILGASEKISKATMKRLLRQWRMSFRRGSITLEK